MLPFNLLNDQRPYLYSIKNDYNFIYKNLIYSFVVVSNQNNYGNFLLL